MITAPDDGLARCHDEARALLTYAVPGARVDVYRPRLRDATQRTTDHDRAYRISVRVHGREDVAVYGSYTLPAPADNLRRDAVRSVEAALKATR